MWKPNLKLILNFKQKFRYFVPVTKDPLFMPEDIREVMEKGLINKVPQIFGVNNSEGFGILSYYYQEKNFNEGLSEEDGRMYLHQFVKLLASVRKCHLSRI